MSYQLMFQKAVELQQNGALNEAEKIYRQILETAPDSADVLNLLGMIAQSRGMHNEAVNYFYKAAANAPHHYPIFFNLAVSLGALGKYLEAIESYQKVLQLRPDCKEALLALGNIYWQQNNLSAAQEKFAAALQIDADYLPARTNLAEINNDVAELENISAGNPYALYYLGRRDFRESNWHNAEKHLSSADSLLEDSEIKTMLAQTLVALHKKAAALPIFYQAYRLNPHDVIVLVNIADLEYEQQNYTAAEEFYQRAISADSQNLRAHANYADMLYQRKRTLEALEEYRQAVLIAPDTPELSYNLALILKSLGEYEQALDLMFHAYYLAPNHDDWNLNLAETLILLHRSEPEKAQRICENWHNKMPENPVVNHLRAVFDGRQDTAEKEYNRLLFDNFAATYEQTLTDIGYKVVDKIAELYAPIRGLIIDLGCGSGLVGAKLKTADNRFIGVDISANMLQLARAKDVYDDLICCDLSEYLQTKPAQAATFIAADVFCYFGALDSLFSGCYPQPLIFSVETSSQCTDFMVQDNGRYKHNPQYIKCLLRQAGYQKIEAHELTLRQENSAPVAGMLFRAASD